jgi:hypothetical protein
MRNKLALAVALMCAMGPQPAHARCFSRWYYPWPQQCGGRVNRVLPIAMRVYQPDIPLPPARDGIDFPLPDMAFTACEAPDERTAGLLLLRAKLEGDHDGR